jgi:hypothetical protein
MIVGYSVGPQDAHACCGMRPRPRLLLAGKDPPAIGAGAVQDSAHPVPPEDQRWPALKTETARRRLFSCSALACAAARLLETNGGLPSEFVHLADHDVDLFYTAALLIRCRRDFAHELSQAFEGVDHFSTVFPASSTSDEPALIYFFALPVRFLFSCDTWPCRATVGASARACGFDGCI